jgi:hypothetical protein
VRAYLQDARLWRGPDLESAIQNSVLAFRRALHNFRFGDPPRSLGRLLFDPTSPDNLRMRRFRLALDSHFARTIGEAFEQINEAITIVAYNLDYDGYRHLLTFGPLIHERPAKSRLSTGR